MENHKTITSNGGSIRSREVVIKERFKLQSYDWENFSVLRKRLRKIGGCTCRFDCTLFLPSAHYEK